MSLVIAQLVGVVMFCVGVLLLGLWLRRRPSADTARCTSMISHILFHAGLSVPMVWGLVWPGIAHFDKIVGLPSLPVPVVWEVLGAVLLMAGLRLGESYATYKRHVPFLVPRWRPAP